MKLPEIKSNHKLRDGKILRLYVRDNLSCEKLAPKFNLTASRIQQIIYENRNLVKIDQEWEKHKRIAWLKRQIEKNNDSRKDPADLQEQLRKEIEGDKPEIDNSKHLHQTYVWITPNQSPANPVSAPRISGADTLPSS